MDHLSLVELNLLIQDTLKNNLDPSYWIIAEIGELNVNQKGHCYLELIENQDDKTVAKARATIWSYTYRNLSTWFHGITGQPLSIGMKILANVKINFHELYGFSLNIQDIDANYTLGEKERLKQEVINKLIADGIFEMNKELRLPLVPQNIAVISSPTAAGYGDFSEHLEKNNYGYQITDKLFPAIMQGEEAPESIIAALHKISENNEIDIVVLIRGGGSQLDLECFNDYDLCSNIAQFPLPVITGIGHDRDETIADLVAHSKQKTPTAVAEFILQGFMAYEAEINEIATRIGRTAQTLLQNEGLRLQHLAVNIGMRSRSIVHAEDIQLNALKDRISMLCSNQFNSHRDRLDRYENKHNDLNPARTLERGYTFTTIKGRSIRNKTFKKGDVITTYSANQLIESTIDKIKKNDEI